MRSDVSIHRKAWAWVADRCNLIAAQDGSAGVRLGARPEVRGTGASSGCLLPACCHHVTTVAERYRPLARKAVGRRSDAAPDRQVDLAPRPLVAYCAESVE